MGNKKIKKLLPQCPHCGYQKTEVFKTTGDFPYRVRCVECGASGPPRWTEKEAVEAWSCRGGERGFRMEYRYLIWNLKDFFNSIDFDSLDAEEEIPGGDIAMKTKIENGRLRRENETLEDKIDVLSNQLLGAEEAISVMTEDMVSDEMKNRVDKLQHMIDDISALVTSRHGDNDTYLMPECDLPEEAVTIKRLFDILDRDVPLE